MNLVEHFPLLKELNVLHKHLSLDTSVNSAEKKEI